MLYRQDMKFEEVADALHINHKTVRSQKDRAIVLIKQMIPEKLKPVAGKIEDTGNK